MARLELPALAMPSVGALGTRNVALAAMSISVAILFASPIAAYAETKAPDMTDYTSMYRDVYKNILDNEKSIAAYKENLKDMSEKLSDIEIAKIQKSIDEKSLKNAQLHDRASELERLNIESYILDEETQKIFDEAEATIRDNFLGVNGVYEMFTEKKYRKVVVFVDPDGFESSNYTRGIEALIDEIQKSVSVDVEVNVAKYVLTHATGCPSATSPCHPARGGIQIAYHGSDESGSTLGFKARHPVYGDGFIIAGHEARSVNTNIVQPKQGGTIGVAKIVFNQYTCDCAFIQITGGHTVNDVIWIPGVGTYPIAVRNTEPALSGSMVMFSVVYGGAGNVPRIGHIILEGDTSGFISITPVTGDSGAALIKPRADGKADLYGMMVGAKKIVEGSDMYYGRYTPYDLIKSKLGLLW